MLQQVSDFELELMKTIWDNGGTALYAEITSALEIPDLKPSSCLSFLSS